MPRLITHLGEITDELRGGGLAIGNFDAVHRGHAVLIGELVKACRQQGGPSIVFTFDPPPAKILNPQLPSPPALTWIQRRVEILGLLGVEVVIVYPTDQTLLDMAAPEFFYRVVVDAIGAKTMVEGPNFMFGKDRDGNVDVLRQLCTQADVTLRIVQPQLLEQQLISSTRIRTLIANGQLDSANRLLVRPYRLAGKVVRGAGRGRLLGFPTANLEKIPILIPALGVYAGRVDLDGKSWPVAINIGPNPTFHDDQSKVEVHVIGWQGTLYDQVVEIDMLARLRDVQTFPSKDALMLQISSDLQQCIQIASQPSISLF